MADLKISQLPTDTPTAAAVLPFVEGGANKKAALTAFLAVLIDSAPGTLDTLNELAAALGDDPNFSATVATQLGLKADDSAVVHKTGNETVSGTKDLQGAATGTDALTTRVVADANPRWTLNANGTQEWGDGTSSADTNLFRSSADLLRTDDDFRARRFSTGPIDSRYLYYTGSGTHPGTATSIFGFGTEFTAPSTATVAAAGVIMQLRTAAAAFTLTDMRNFHSQAPTVGSGSTITNLYGILVDGMTGATNNYGVAIGAAGTQTLWIGHLADSTTAAAGIAFGLSRDTNLYRSAADSLKTDDSFTVGASLICGAGGGGNIAKVGGTIFDHSADAGNTTTSETDLYSDTLPASILNTNNHKISATYDGIFAANTTTKQIRVYFGGTLVYDSGALALLANLTTWTVKVRVIRVSSSVVRVAVDFNGAALTPPTYTEVTGLTLTNTQVLKITGQAGSGGANNDIVAKMGTVRFDPAA